MLLVMYATRPRGSRFHCALGITVGRGSVELLIGPYVVGFQNEEMVEPSLSRRKKRS